MPELRVFVLGDYMFVTYYIPLPAGIIADVITTALEEAIEKETMTIGKTMENHRTQGGGALPGRADSGRLQAGTQLEDSFLRGGAF